MYAGLTTGTFMASMQLGTAAVLWTNSTGPPLESQLPWQFLSELVIHGLGLTVCGVTPYDHSLSGYLPFSTNEITRYAITLLATMTGRFLKAGELDRRHKTHFQQWIMPIISAVFASHHGDFELGGVLVILVAAVTGQPQLALEQHTPVSDKTVLAGEPSMLLHATDPQVQVVTPAFFIWACFLQNVYMLVFMHSSICSVKPSACRLSISRPSCFHGLCEMCVGVLQP